MKHSSWLAKGFFYFLLLVCSFQNVVGQLHKDSVRTKGPVMSGNISVTNNGFSLIPAFTLGSSAMQAIVKVAGKRLSFEPEFRYGLNGKPWSFVFIWRYKLIQHERFTLNLGTHLPAINFVTAPLLLNGEMQDVTRARQFFPVFECNPQWVLHPRVSAGVMYQYAIAQAKELARETHFLSFRGSISRVPLGSNVLFNANAQLFYLKMDANDGVYMATGVSVGKKAFPFSLAANWYQAFQTNIPGKKQDWNLSLVYTF